LIEKLLVYNPDERLSAAQAKNHIYFRDLRDMEVKRFRQISKRGVQRERESSLEHDSSVSSNHGHGHNNTGNHQGNVSFINININANNSASNNMNININTKNHNNLPGLKSTLMEKGINRNTQISDESDVDLPPINQKKDYMLHLYQKRKKYIPSTDHSLTNLTVLNQIPNSKVGAVSMKDKKKLQMKEQQKNYISPYSQKNSKGQINQNYE